MDFKEEFYKFFLMWPYEDKRVLSYFSQEDIPFIKVNKIKNIIPDVNDQKQKFFFRKINKNFYKKDTRPRSMESESSMIYVNIDCQRVENWIKYLYDNLKDFKENLLDLKNIRFIGEWLKKYVPENLLCDYIEDFSKTPVNKKVLMFDFKNDIHKKAEEILKYKENNNLDEFVIITNRNYELNNNFIFYDNNGNNYWKSKDNTILIIDVTNKTNILLYN